MSKITEKLIFSEFENELYEEIDELIKIKSRNYREGIGDYDLIPSIDFCLEDFVAYEKLVEKLKNNGFLIENYESELDEICANACRYYNNEFKLQTKTTAEDGRNCLIELLREDEIVNGRNGKNLCLKIEYLIYLDTIDYKLEKMSFCEIDKEDNLGFVVYKNGYNQVCLTSENDLNLNQIKDGLLEEIAIYSKNNYPDADYQVGNW